MDVSKNRGTPKSSILIGFFITNHPFWGPTPIFGNIQVFLSVELPVKKITAAAVSGRDGRIVPLRNQGNACALQFLQFPLSNRRWPPFCSRNGRIIQIIFKKRIMKKDISCHPLRGTPSTITCPRDISPGCFKVVIRPSHFQTPHCGPTPLGWKKMSLQMFSAQQIRSSWKHKAKCHQNGCTTGQNTSSAGQSLS